MGFKWDGMPAGCKGPCVCTCAHDGKNSFVWCVLGSQSSYAVGLAWEVRGDNIEVGWGLPLRSSR